jgi:hypothetical protein
MLEHRCGGLLSSTEVMPAGCTARTGRSMAFQSLPAQPAQPARPPSRLASADAILTYLTGRQAPGSQLGYREYEASLSVCLCPQCLSGRRPRVCKPRPALPCRSSWTPSWARECTTRRCRPRRRLRDS